MDRSEDARRPHGFEALLQELSALGRAGAGPCPDLAAFAGSNCEPWALAAHVEGCTRCHELLSVAHEAGPRAVPQGRIASAIERLSRRRLQTAVLLRIVARALGGAIVPVEIMGEPVAAVPTRATEAHDLVAEARSRGLRVRTQVSSAAAGRFAVLLDVSHDGQDGRPTEDVQVTLTRDERALASLSTRLGRVTFGALRPGAYRLVLARSGSDVGVVELELRGSEFVA